MCIDDDGDGNLDLPYCTSWRQPGANELCLGPLYAFPGAPSKCRCDSINVGDEIPIPKTIEVSSGEIREALELGALGPNQLKTQTRCGMGACQARMCGLTLSEMIAHHRKADMTDVGYLRIRPPIKPITVDQLSEMAIVE